MASVKRIRRAQFRFGRVLKEVNDKLNAGDNSKKIFDFMFDSLSVVIPYDRIGIATIEGEGAFQQICCRWMRSKLPNPKLGIGYCAPLKGSSLENILKSGRPRIINDLQKYAFDHPQSQSTALALRDGIRSSLTCPLYSNKEPVGVVFFSSREVDTYSTEHFETYSEIANELSVIIEQDRLRDEAEKTMSKSQNVRMILHDLKSPLGIVQSYLNVAHDEDWFKSLSIDAQEIFAIIERNASHMLGLLEELAELSQLNFATEKIKLAQVSLRDFIKKSRFQDENLPAKKKSNFKFSWGKISRKM
ncbi:MAG: GAF domain-containing protein [Parachlamydiales bacterium]